MPYFLLDHVSRTLTQVPEGGDPGDCVVAEESAGMALCNPGPSEWMSSTLSIGGLRLVVNELPSAVQCYIG